MARRQPVDDKAVHPSVPAGILAGALLIGGLALGVFADAGKAFDPRVENLDALAALAIGAFFVDRMLTFIPVLAAEDKPLPRAADLKVLRLGWGALIGGVFVLLTDLRAVEVLTSENSTALDPRLDRGIAVLAIAGGVAGLAKFAAKLNPQPPTDGSLPKDNETTNETETPVVTERSTAVAGVTEQPTAVAGQPAAATERLPAVTEQAPAATEQPATTDPAGDPPALPPPSYKARALGIAAVVFAALLARTATGDENGIDLVGPEEGADGTVEVVLRFGVALIAAAVIEQLLEWTDRFAHYAKQNKPLYIGGAAVVMGVLAAWVLDLYLLHNLGFFGTGSDLNTGIAASGDAAQWGDRFVTGAVIAAGTKPLHDLSSRLRKPKEHEEGDNSVTTGGP